MAKASVEALSDDACVFAGIGGSTADAIELIEGYDRHDVDGIMIMPPDHTDIHEQGALDYYQKLVDVGDRPLARPLGGFDPSVHSLADLTRIGGGVGVKYALEDAVKPGACVKAHDGDVVWVDGLVGSYAVIFCAEGIKGFSAEICDFRSEVGLAFFDGLQHEE